MTSARKVIVRVRRQDSPEGKIYWEEFNFAPEAAVTVADILKMIAKEPVNKSGGLVAPVVWEDGCGNGQCGSCAMLINGKPLLACMAKLADFPPAPIVLEPLSKFPVIRDLLIDRADMFEWMKRAGAWTSSEADGTREKVISDEALHQARDWARCIHCGICIEACPSMSTISEFVGPAAVTANASCLAMTPPGPERERLLIAMMSPGGVADCGNAGNCMRLCPVGISITSAIAYVNREANKMAWKGLFGG